ncbi:cation:proton antiporter [Salisediminibacterium halotolerans]|uniref:Monovalent cation:H+ antiporter, CPA1 family n=1 Tax=Salisediminibacterium halotolerans TaxID=517425 RepID=A0A1H9V090_9BACI|nr:cation:proton antiporter [Salisediminibacterium haloalkalitolerans]SES15155.1 monovalent cation:H+ antiporter, CPA1 family [Salisediminibacterium haloalkalitolerans]
MTIAPYIFLLFIGYIVYTFDRHKEVIPVPPVLVFIGIVLSFIPFFQAVDVTADLIYHVMLPAILFVSAYEFPIEKLKRYAGNIFVLGTIGMLATVVVTGLFIFSSLSFFLSLPLLAAFLIAAVLVPTDPVSVVQILSKDLNDELVTTTVEGESMLNDGTSIVVFTFILQAYLGSAMTLPQAALELLFVSAGGIAVGAAGGWLYNKAVPLTHERLYQVMLSIILVYGVFLTAEAVHVSGVLAVISTGLIVSLTFSRSHREDHFRESLDGFWKTIEISVLSLLFLLIGITAAPYLVHSYWLAVVILFIITLFTRWLVVAGLLSLLPLNPSPTNKESFLISLTGVKGAVSVYFILKMQEQTASDTELITAIAFSAVILSLIVQSLVIHPAALKMRE